MQFFLFVCFVCACVASPLRWLLLGFQREFEHSDALRLFEILSCDHLELISQQVDRARYQERLAQRYCTGEAREKKAKQVKLFLKAISGKWLTAMCLFLAMFPEDSSESELPAFNTDFTFELFICAAILLDNRESLLRCRDDVQLIQFSSRFVPLCERYLCISKSV